MWEDRNEFPLSGDSGCINSAETTLSEAVQLNPASGYVESTKKMLAGSIYSAEAGLNRKFLNENVLYRVSGQKGWLLNSSQAFTLPGKLRSILNTVRFIRARLSPSSYSQLSYAGGKRFSVIFLLSPSF
jgi:hypothetical protein